MKPPTNRSTPNFMSVRQLCHAVAVRADVSPATFSFDIERLRRFELEVQASGQLNHPKILAVYDVQMHGGSPYAVCELLEVETLRQRLRSGPLPPRKAIDYGLQIARGLAAAHENGIVHRDLKPVNLFVTQEQNGLQGPLLISWSTVEVISGRSRTGPNNTACSGRCKSVACYLPCPCAPLIPWR